MKVLKSHLSFAAAAAWAIWLLAPVPAVAQQPNGYPVTNVNLRAGPGTEYPVIVTVPGRAPISILGCLPDYSWCDSLFQGNRGWMRSIYLSGYYQGNYYSLGDYAPRLGYRTVSFDVDGYWASNYRDRPFYGERKRWTRPREEGFVDTGVFYNRLAPYGSWVWIQGQYVWVPSRVDRSWRPYTRGRWVYTDRGWTWVSNEPFGWATYHYGRWGFSDRVGWFWVPGHRWAPAWVSWRESDDYLAWAPMPPAYDGGININVSIGTVPDYYWQVVPSRSFLSDDLQGQIVHDRNRRRPILERSRALGNTTITNNNVVVNNVVNVTYVEEKTKEKVVERKIGRAKDAKAAGVEGDVVEIFQPAADVTPADLAPPEPKTIKEVAEESQTKGQAEGEATTEEMLVPPEIQKAQVKAAKQKEGETPKNGEPTAPATGGEAPLSPSLPKGGEASAPPPEGAAPAGEPVPAEDLTPAAAEPVPPAPSGEAPPAPATGETPPPPPEDTAPPPAEVPAAPPAEQAPTPDVAPPIEEQAPAKTKEKGLKPKKDSKPQPEATPPMKPLPRDEAPPPPPPPAPPAPEEMAPPPPPPPLPMEEPKPKQGKAREDKSKKAKDKGAPPSGPPAMGQAAPPPPPPLPPVEDPGSQLKQEGKGRNDNGGPPPPDGEGGKKAKNKEGPPPCPEGTAPVDDGSCAPMQ